MIEIELFDGTILEFPEGTPDDVINKVAMQETMAIQGKEPKADQSIGQMLYENIVGVGEADTPGEKLGQYIRGAGAAVARGIADVPAIPANIAQLGALGVEKLLGMEEPSAVSRALESLPETRDVLSTLTGGESEYVAPGTAGEYISTIGEFAGGVGPLSKTGRAKEVAENMLRYGVLPGAASEAAGQATEGTVLEPYARTAAGLGAGLLAQKRMPVGGKSQTAELARTVEEGGVNLSAGQATRSDFIRRLEGKTQPTGGQLDQFTSSVMKMMGSSSKTADPKSLSQLGDDIIKQMDDAVRGVKIKTQPAHGAAAKFIGQRYLERVPAGNLTPRIKGIADEIDALAKANQPVSLSQLKEWRMDIGDLTIVDDIPTRNAAHALRNLIDKMTDEALRASGRAENIAKLKKARERYRNFVGLRDAATRAGAEAGDLSPAQLNQSMIRAQGRTNYATGRTTDMADFTRGAAATMRPMPTVEAGGVRRLANAAPLASAIGAATGVGALTANPLLAGAAGAVGAMAPAAIQAGVRSRPVQNVIRNPAATAAELRYILPGLLSQ